jgi:hypothetical protein
LPKLVSVDYRTLIRTHIRTNLTTAGMSRERYFELLEHVK